MDMVFYHIQQCFLFLIETAVLIIFSNCCTACPVKTGISADHQTDAGIILPHNTVQIIVKNCPRSFIFLILMDHITDGPQIIRNFINILRFREIGHHSIQRISQYDQRRCHQNRHNGS